MNNILTRYLRTGLIATSLSAAMIMAGAMMASAQSTSPQDDPAHQAAIPQSAQTAPNQDNAARPTPDKDKDKEDAARQQANPQDRDAMPASNDKDLTQSELKAWDRFLDSHPQIAQDLQKDPSKVNDTSWLSQHQDLEKFLDQHPKLREELKQNPSAIMNRQQKYEKNEPPASNPQR